MNREEKTIIFLFNAFATNIGIFILVSALPIITKGIHDFGKNLVLLRIVHNSSIITGYGKDLILKLIGEYPVIIKNLN